MWVIAAATRTATFACGGEAASIEDPAGSDDGTARLWDTATAEALGPPMRHEGRMLFLAFSRDRRLSELR